MTAILSSASTLHTRFAPTIWYILIAYIFIISIIAVIITRRDKHAAAKNRRRTPEARLLWIAFFGGSAAMYITMRLIRHKTRHNKFMLGIPAIMLLQLLLAAAILLALSFV